jgi:hypothetical protein
MSALSLQTTRVIPIRWRHLGFLWVAVLLISAIYCELSSVVYSHPVTLHVSALWAVQTWWGWMALSLFSARAAKWNVNARAPRAQRSAVLLCAGIAGSCLLDTLGLLLLDALGWITPIDLVENLYRRLPSYFVGAAFVTVVFEFLRWKTFRASEAPASSRDVPDEISPPSPGIVIPTRDGATSISWADVESMESAGNYVQIQLSNGKSFLHRTTLKQMEVVARSHGLLRIHRTALVNPAHVRAKLARNRLKLHSGRELRIGRSFRDLRLPK